MENKLLILEAFTFTLDSFKYAEAERYYQESLSVRYGARGDGSGGNSKAELLTQATVVSATGDGGLTKSTSTLSLSEQVARAREHIQTSLTYSPSTHSFPSGGVSEDPEMREENELLRKKVENLENQVKQLTDRVTKLEASCKTTVVTKVDPSPIKPVVVEAAKVEDDDDDVDLFESDEEDNGEAAALKEKRLAEYAAKKSKKPALVAKSNVILDVKPWDDETDMKELEKAVRSIEMDGLFWGSSKLVAVGFGIKKLQITTVVEDEKVSIEELQEKIEGFEDFIQSVDIAAFNKI